MSSHFRFWHVTPAMLPSCPTTPPTVLYRTECLCSTFDVVWKYHLHWYSVRTSLIVSSLCQLSPFKRVVYMCSLFLHKDAVVMSANLPSEWPGLLPVGLFKGPSRDCLWTAHKGQSWPECGGWCEELTCSLSLWPLCHSLCPTLAGWLWCCSPGMWRWSCPTCGDTGGRVWDITRHQGQCEHLDSAWAQSFNWWRVPYQWYISMYSVQAWEGGECRHKFLLNWSRH